MIKRIFRWIPGLLLLAAALGMLAGWALGARLCAVLSGSMEPALPVGSLLLLLPEDDPQPGDILTFNGGEMLVTHRAVHKNADGSLTTKGDANNVEDARPLYPEQILGRVTLCLPGLGYAADWAARHRAWLWGAAVVLLGGAALPARRHKSKEVQPCGGQNTAP